MPATNSRKAAAQGVGKTTNRRIAKEAPSLIDVPFGLEGKPTEGCIDKEAPFWSFLNLERV